MKDTGTIPRTTVPDTITVAWTIYFDSCCKLAHSKGTAAVEAILRCEEARDYLRAAVASEADTNYIAAQERQKQNQETAGNVAKAN